jgi:predicted Fe-Mo cluster-binding NifX family protein
MTCWKWFDGTLKEAGVKVTDKNRQKIDQVIHNYVGEQSSYGRCSADWRKARKEIQENDEMKQELIEKLRSAI